MQKSEWTFTLEEVRQIVNAEDRYPRWANLHRHVLRPAVEAINDYGTVTVTMIPKKTGKAVTDVQFGWEWKTVSRARETDEENARHSKARNRKSDGKAPPLTDEKRADAKATHALTRHGASTIPGATAQFLGRWQTRSGCF